VKTSRYFLLFAGLLIVLTEQSWACSVCMGSNGVVPDAGGSDLGGAINGAIFVMLGLIGTVLTGISAVAYSLYKRANAALPVDQELEQLMSGLDQGQNHA